MTKDARRLLMNKFGCITKTTVDIGVVAGIGAGVDVGVDVDAGMMGIESVCSL
jgi:hypothetical protein